MKTIVTKYPSLYVREDEKIREWKVAVIIIDGKYNIHSTTGVLGSEKFTNQYVVIQSGKNIGRSNETSVAEQANKEAESKWEDKRKRGMKSLKDLGVTETIHAGIGERPAAYYKVGTFGDPLTLEQLFKLYLPKEKTDKSGLVKPMKCQKYYKTVKAGIVPTIKHPTFAQTKINGVRALLSWSYKEKKAILTSKEGLVYKLPHITDTLKAEDFLLTTLPEGLEYISSKTELGTLITIQVNGETNEIFVEELLTNKEIETAVNEEYGTIQPIIYDGELYIHDTILADITSAVRTYSLQTTLVEFRVFDLAIPNVLQANRITLLQNMNIENKSNSIRLVKNTWITNHDMAVDYMNWAISKGYEGAIFRSPTNVYNFGGRPATIVKMKQRESGEFLILDVVDTDVQPGVGIFLCRNDINQSTFKVNPQGTIAQRKHYFSNKADCIKKLLTVEYYERTAPPDSLPFHAVGIAIRDYEK